MWQKIKQNWKKISGSVILSSFFLFFWINGPINKQPDLVAVDNQLSGFALPKLVGQKKEVKDIGLIISSETKQDNSTNGLLSAKKEDIAHSGLINTKPGKKTLSEQAQKLVNHAHKILNVPEAELQAEGNYVMSTSAIYFESGPWLDHIVGYAGPINVGLVLDKNNKIQSVHIISSHETESYLRKIQRAGYYQQYQDLAINKGQKRIDGVSGATITSHAVGEIVENMVLQATVDKPNYASSDTLVFSLEVKNTLFWVLHLVVIVALFAFGYQNKVKKTKRNMLILSIISVVYIGFFLNNSFTYISFIEPFVGSTLSAFSGIYAFAAIMGSVWSNNLYCKYVCPFGHIQRLTIKLPFIKKRKIPLSNLWLERIRNILTLVLFIGILLGLRQWKNYEVFPILFGANIVSIGFAITFLVLVVSTIYPMFWCRVACPTGCVLDTVKRLSK